MTVLGIDTSQQIVSFALIEDGKILSSFEGDVGRDLVSKISEIITNLLSDSGKNLSQIQRCGIVVGPGSFTGLRIGIAFTKGLFACSNVEFIPISSLECIAKSLQKENEKIDKFGEISVILDARQGEVFYYNTKGAEERIMREELAQKSKTAQIIEYPCELLQIRGVVAAKMATKSTKLYTIDDIFPNYMQVSYAERCKK